MEEGDEILSITQAGQVVRSPINDHFRATGRSTMGVKFVTPKEGDAVAVVARSVEAKEADVLPDESAEPRRRRGRRIARCGRGCDNRRDREPTPTDTEPPEESDA